MNKAYLEEMERAGVEIHRYHGPQWCNLSKLNNRTHRKLLVVDGRIGFTGGWASRTNGLAPHKTRITGGILISVPKVRSSDRCRPFFMDNWMKATSAVLHGDAYFPSPTVVAHSRAQMFMSSPTSGAESMHLMYLLALTAAKRSIQLSMAYFVPDDLAAETLIAALKRGVMVQIILPGPKGDAALVRRASELAGANCSRPAQRSMNTSPPGR